MNRLYNFIHIFKCGGTFFTGGLKYTYNKEEICSYGEETNNPSAALLRIETKQKKIKLYYGHMQFGDAANFHRPTVYLTVVRDPVDQLLSTYYCLREDKCKTEILHSVFHKFSFEEVVSLSCLDKVSSIEALYLTYFIDNHQSRMLSGTFKTLAKWHLAFPEHKISPTNILINESDAIKAINNLDKYFSFIGLCHQTDYYWTLLNKRFGFNIPAEAWHSSNPYFSNKTRFGRVDKEDLSQEVIQMIHKRNQHDLKTYDWAKKNMNRINSRPVIEVPY